MSQPIYPIPDKFQKHAHITESRYRELYRRSIDDPEGFWSDQADRFLNWSTRWNKVLDWDFSKGHVCWFLGGAAERLL